MCLRNNADQASAAAVCVLWCAGAWDYQVGCRDWQPGPARAHCSFVPPCSALALALHATAYMHRTPVKLGGVHTALKRLLRAGPCRQSPSIDVLCTVHMVQCMVSQSTCTGISDYLDAVELPVQHCQHSVQVPPWWCSEQCLHRPAPHDVTGLH